LNNFSNYIINQIEKKNFEVDQQITKLDEKMKKAMETQVHLDTREPRYKNAEFNEQVKSPDTDYSSDTDYYDDENYSASEEYDEEENYGVVEDYVGVEEYEAVYSEALAAKSKAYAKDRRREKTPGSDRRGTDRRKTGSEQGGGGSGAERRNTERRGANAAELDSNNRIVYKVERRSRNTPDEDKEKYAIRRHRGHGRTGNPQGNVSLNISEKKYGNVLKHAEKGMDVAEIAKALGIGKGEVELILGLKDYYEKS
jgi:hypothetical protein